MNVNSEKLAAELRKAVSCRKAASVKCLLFAAEIAKLEEELENSKVHSDMLTSVLAEGRAKIAANKIRIATLDAEKVACVQMEKFIAMHDKVKAMKEAAEGRLSQLHNDLEDIKDIKSTRFGIDDNSRSVYEKLEAAQMQILSNEIEELEKKEHALTDKINFVPQGDIPLTVKNNIFNNLKNRKGALLDKLIQARCKRNYLNARASIINY
ncbi:unnamed protein product [Thelazia callipaeda]|uniref:Myosin-9-like n=1 Tax=Thelazia callipaeda TaxID=103827 RepID=A0A0N5D3X6_THECL|nr:unnamed protein product [Thelazia callipaeda]